MRLRFFFDSGSGSALWSGDEEAREAYGVGPLDDVLPLRPWTRAALVELADWWDTDLDWSDPAGPRLWGEADEQRFHREAARVLEKVRAEVPWPVEADWLRVVPSGPPETPPGVRRLDEAAAVLPLLRHDPGLHLYALADLDPLAWPELAFFEREGQVLMGWYGAEPPCYMALGHDAARMRELLRCMASALPPRMYLHLTPGCHHPLGEAYDLERTGLMQKMLLHGAAAAAEEPCEELGPRHQRELRELYEVAYPDGWFDPRTLATRRYVGLRREGRLVAVAGVHAWSPSRSVAALGNIATHPAWRGQGLARTCVARLCARLQAEDGIAHVGLNVRRDNGSAVRCYEGLGFRLAAEYEEWTAERRPG